MEKSYALAISRNAARMVYDMRITMNIIRFIFPFLFVRNWYNGAWKLSSARCLLFGALAALIILGLLAIYFMQAPVTYSSRII